MGRKGVDTVAMDRARAFATIVAIRSFEEAQRDLWTQGRIPGELHTSIGEEAIIAGVTMHLGDDDATAIDHRSTGPLIARGVDPEGVLLEVLGSEHGISGGRAGHMHLLVPDLLAASDGIVGSSGPLATGFALAAKRLRPGSVAVAFFGEGAANQGMLLESLNLAVAWNLPVLFVCKDNGWSITTPTRRVTGGDLVARCQRPDGHFTTDPMLRILHDPVGQAQQLAEPLIRAAGTTPGGGLGQRGRALAGLAGRLGLLGLQRGLRRRDALVHARRLLDRATADEIEARIRGDCDATVSRVLARLATATRSGSEVAT